MKKDIILFGIQWSWKWTQAEEILKQFPWLYSYFATGALFRALIANENAIGNYLRERVENGDLIHDDVTIALFNAYMQTVIDDKKQMLLDGYPRTIEQMKSTIALMNKNKRTLLGIQLVLPDEVAIERMQERWRKDDTPESIQHRINQFYDKTQPMIDRFAENQNLIKVKADRTVEEVWADINKILNDLG